MRTKQRAVYVPAMHLNSSGAPACGNTRGAALERVTTLPKDVTCKRCIPLILAANRKTASTETLRVDTLPEMREVAPENGAEHPKPPASLVHLTAGSSACCGAAGGVRMVGDLDLVTCLACADSPTAAVICHTEFNAIRESLPATSVWQEYRVAGEFNDHGRPSFRPLRLKDDGWKPAPVAFTSPEAAARYIARRVRDRVREEADAKA